jgi:hypothetical protein
MPTTEMPAGSFAMWLRVRVKRVLVWCYLRTRPVALPMAMRLHRVLSRLLEKEAGQPARTGAPAEADAALLESVERARLTLTLLCREGRS